MFSSRVLLKRPATAGNKGAPATRPDHLQNFFCAPPRNLIPELSPEILRRDAAPKTLFSLQN
jgi:hypothetical protein